MELTSRNIQHKKILKCQTALYKFASPTGLLTNKNLQKSVIATPDQ